VQDRGPAAYIAEFIGTFGLVFFITLVVSLYVVPPTPQAPIQPFIDFSVVGLVHAFALFLLIQTLAVVSGAHFNPAITAAFLAIRQIKPADAAVYVVCQLAGGVAGALLTKALVLDEGDPVNYGAPVVSARLDGEILPGMIAELVGTFFLVFAVVGVAVNPRALKDWSGLVIGTTLGLVVMVFAPLTGASVNPARAFGPALVAGEFGGTDDFLLVYVLAPVIGAVLAAAAFFYLFILPGRREEGMEPVG
jgi:MIP family channel proteins